MGLLSGLQTESAARLAEQEFFSDAAAEQPRPIAVLTEQIGDVQNQIERKVAALGIVALVLTLSATNESQNRQRPYFSNLALVVRVQENVLLNRSASGSGQSASLVAEAVAWHLHAWTPPSLSCTAVFERITLVDHAALLTYDVVFRLQAGLTSAPTRTPLSLPT